MNIGKLCLNFIYAKIKNPFIFSKDKILKKNSETLSAEVCLYDKRPDMKSTLKTEEGYGYNATMLPDYDGFIIIKPEFLKYTDDIIRDLHRIDYSIVEATEKTLTKEEAEEIYSCHKGKAFFDELIEYMTSSPCIGMILMSPFSDRDSSIETLKELKDKYRKRYGIDKTRNVIHSSDSYQSVLHEAEAFFGNHEASLSRSKEVIGLK